MKTSHFYVGQDWSGALFMDDVDSRCNQMEDELADDLASLFPSPPSGSSYHLGRPFCWRHLVQEKRTRTCPVKFGISELRWWAAQGSVTISKSGIRSCGTIINKRQATINHVNWSIHNSVFAGTSYHTFRRSLHCWKYPEPEHTVHLQD